MGSHSEVESLREENMSLRWQLRRLRLEMSEMVKRVNDLEKELKGKVEGECAQLRRKLNEVCAEDLDEEAKGETETEDEDENGEYCKISIREYESDSEKKRKNEDMGSVQEDRVDDRQAEKP